MLAKPFTFHKAQPIWETGCEKEMNKTLVFKTSIARDGDPVLCLACSTTYILYVNGKFVAEGPARTAHGHHRVDEIPLKNHLNKNANVISVHVNGAPVPCFSISRHDSFFCAEIIDNGNVVSYTNQEKSFWGCYAYPHRVQQVHKYSEQRAFGEVYRLSPEVLAIDKELNAGESIPVSLIPTGKFIYRDVYYTDYEPLIPLKKQAQGTFKLEMPQELKMPIYYDQAVYEQDLGKFKFKGVGYPLEDREYDYALQAKKVCCQPSNQFDPNTSKTELHANTYFDLDMGCNYTGLIRATVTCSEKTTLYAMFDELLTDDGDINITRLTCINLVVWELEAGTYELTTSEAYTMRYLRFACMDGACTVSDPQLLRVSFPPVNRKLNSNDKKLQAVYNAAVETFRQNVYDVYMDCPSRERAGWLCDSFFTARAEHSLTGKSLVERAFLANFLLPDEIPYTPEGMLPCCHPAEMNRVHFIPNWAMWFVLELEEYLERTGDHSFVIAAKPKMMKLLNYFRQFENEYGLLESLESWIFVEWSQANKLVRDVNFPTNMLFSRTKRALAKLYDMPELAAEADIMDKNIIDLSLDGLFFCDNALRQDGKLVLSGEHTEVCQYYAFFCGTVTPDSHPKLWKTMVEDFGPQRTSAYPEVHSANTFIGHYLRLDIFHRYGLKDNVLENIIGYFYYMAEKVGSLWENKTPHASCCHGFTSCVIYWLDKFGMLE